MTIKLIGCFVYATSVDFAAGGYPNVTAFRYGDTDSTWTPAIAPTAAEPAADFAARLETALNTEFQNLLTAEGYSATFTPFTVTESVVGLNQRFTISSVTITSPDDEDSILSTLRSTGQIQTGAGLTIEFDRAAATATTSDFQVLSISAPDVAAAVALAEAAAVAAQLAETNAETAETNAEAAAVIAENAADAAEASAAEIPEINYHASVNKNAGWNGYQI